jgi:hypothetical protein
MADRQPVQATTPMPVTRAMVVEALQDAWNDFTSDTGCFPECFKVIRGKLFADFDQGHFASMVTTRLLDEMARAEGEAAHGKR